MAYLTAAVVVVGLLCLLDLVLTLGVIRRLREHTNLLSQVPHRLPGELGVPAGDPVDEFAATTIAGEPMSRELLTGRTLVGFFAPGCQPCAEQLPGFVERARSMPDGRAQVLAVVIGSDGDENTKDTGYVGQLAPVARVVMEAPEGPVQMAFRVSGYPTLYMVDSGGVVAAGGMSIDALENALAPSVTELPRHEPA